MERSAHRFSIPVLALLAILVGCVTVNVYFPAAPAVPLRARAGVCRGSHNREQRDHPGFKGPDRPEAPGAAPLLSAKPGGDRQERLPGGPGYRRPGLATGGVPEETRQRRKRRPPPTLRRGGEKPQPQTERGAPGREDLS